MSGEHDMGAALRRDQSAHERLIPLLVEIIGATSYLELGTHQNETISKVTCWKRYGVDINAADCDGATMFKMSTREFLETVASGLAPFDFVFIDADHAAESVRKDFSQMWPFVSPDGIVCLHDTNPEKQSDATPGLCDDSWKFALYLLGAGHESVTLPYHPGLTIVRKRDKWGPSE